MEKIDLNEAKRLGRILSGKEKKPDLYQEKLKEVTTKLEVDAITKELTEIKRQIEESTPEVDQTKVRHNMKDWRNKISGIQQDPGLENELYLFSYAGKYHSVHNKVHKIVTESEAKDLISKNSDIKLHYICTLKKMSCPIPRIYNVKDAIMKTAADVNEVVSYINSTSGAKITKTDL